MFNLKGFLSHQCVNHKDAVESYYQFMENCFQLPPQSRLSSNYCKIKSSILGYISHQFCWLAWLRMTVLLGFFWSQHKSDMREWGWAAKIWQILGFKGRTERRTHAKKSARRAELSLLKTPIRSEGCGWRCSEPGFERSEHTLLQKLLRRVEQHLHNHLFPSPSPFLDFVFTLLSANTLAPILAPSTLSAGGHSNPPPPVSQLMLASVIDYIWERLSWSVARKRRGGLLCFCFRDV